MRRGGALFTMTYYGSQMVVEHSGYRLGHRHRDRLLTTGNMLRLALWRVDTDQCGLMERAASRAPARKSMVSNRNEVNTVPALDRRSPYDRDDEGCCGAVVRQSPCN
jgi:hypothetical protein